MNRWLQPAELRTCNLPIRRGDAAGQTAVIAYTFPHQLDTIVRMYPRLAIAGGSRCGKSTMAAHIGDTYADRRVFLHDDFKGFEWDAVPHAMIGATQNLERFVIEGVNVARALRKGLKVDAVIYLHKPRVPRIKGQITQAKGIHTVMKEWREKDRVTPVYVLE